MLIIIILLVLLLVAIIVKINNNKVETKEKSTEVENKGDNTQKLNQKQTLHQQRYYLEYRFIPEMINALLEKKSKDVAAIASFVSSVERWRPVVERSVVDFEYDWDNLKTDSMILGTKELVLFKFPPPNQVPDAAFGIVVFDKEAWIADYYTLEASYNREWVLGKTVINKEGEKTHYNYGNLENPSMQSFINWVRNRYEVKENTSIINKYNDQIDSNLQKILNKFENLDDDNFQQFISKNSNVVVIFYDNNDPSNRIISSIDTIYTKYIDRIKIGKCNVYETDNAEKIILEHNIRALPTLFFYKNGKIINKQVGISSSLQIERLINETL